MEILIIQFPFIWTFAWEVKSIEEEGHLFYIFNSSSLATNLKSANYVSDAITVIRTSFVSPPKALMMAIVMRAGEMEVESEKMSRE